MELERHPDDLPPPEDLPPAPTTRGRVPRGVAWAIALAVVVLAVASFVALDSDHSKSSDVIDLQEALDRQPSGGLTGRDATGQQLPETELERFTGGQTTLAEFRGQPVVVNFFASFCVPCRTEMPAFEQVHRQLGDRVHIVGIDTGEPIESGRRIAADTGVTYPLLSDPPGTTMLTLGAKVLPTTVIADAEGRILLVHNGQLDADQLVGLLRDALPGGIPA